MSPRSGLSRASNIASDASRWNSSNKSAPPPTPPTVFLPIASALAPPSPSKAEIAAKRQELDEIDASLAANNSGNEQDAALIAKTEPRSPPHRSPSGQSTLFNSYSNHEDPLCRIRRWPRVTAYQDTPRKRAALARSRTFFKRETLPLFAELIAEQQPSPDDEMSRRADVWPRSQQADPC